MKNEDFMNQKMSEMTVEELKSAIKIKKRQNNKQPGKGEKVLMKYDEDMEKVEHVMRHKELHRELDELMADFIKNTGRLPSETSLMEFAEWSFKQTKKPEGYWRIKHGKN